LAECLPVVSDYTTSRHFWQAISHIAQQEQLAFARIRARAIPILLKEELRLLEKRGRGRIENSILHWLEEQEAQLKGESSVWKGSWLEVEIAGLNRA
jgi:hypothetical protein